MWKYALLLPKVLHMSLTAGIVIVFVLIARLFLRKAPKTFSYALWAVVLFRLLCPVSFPSPFSLTGLLPATAAGSSAYDAIDRIPEGAVRSESPQAALPAAEAAGVTNGASPQGGKQASVALPEGWVPTATFLWLLGIAVMLAYSAVSLIHLRRKLVGAVRLRDNIYLADHISSPFVIGILHPKIYLPSTLREEERGYVILHEQTHIRRLDHIVKMLAFLALAVHWFNPLVWAAFVFSVRDMEMSCDECVLKQIGGEIKGAYGASLLSLATGRRIINGSPLAFGEGNLKGRIKNVMNFKKPAAWVIAVSVLLVAALSIWLAADTASGNENTPAKSTGPFAEYVKDAESATFDVYTKEGGSYVMCLPWSLLSQFPGSDRTNPNWQPGWMDVDVYCGSVKGFTWAVVCTGPSLGTGSANVCTSTDGGKSWQVGDKDAMYTGTVTGAGFASSKVGFMSYRYYVDQGPEISRTLDGGKTWARMAVDIPESLKTCKMTPLVPTFTAKSGTYPIELFDSDANFISIVYLVTEDGGMTWHWNEKAETASTQAALSPKEQLTNYLTGIFNAEYTKYYDGLHYEMTNYSESISGGNYTATFYWTQHFKNYYKDPDTVGYIKEAKEHGAKDYQGLYDDYNAEHSANFSLKATAGISSDGTLALDTIEILGDTAVKGAPTYNEPLKNYFPEAR